jgi:hypothetical protein
MPKEVIKHLDAIAANTRTILKEPTVRLQATIHTSGTIMTLAKATIRLPTTKMMQP